MDLFTAGMENKELNKENEEREKKGFGMRINVHVTTNFAVITFVVLSGGTMNGGGDRHTVNLGINCQGKSKI